jgi:Uma2 family endonuclease
MGKRSDLDDNARMASVTLIPVSEYLRTTYRPDCDYLEGELRERNVGERPHALMQAILCTIFNANRRAWGVVAAPELRVKVAERRYRIPDVTVMRRSDPPDPVVRVAPLVCVEVVSPSDTLVSLQERVEDYRRMGVEHVWVVDPVGRHAYVASERGFEQPESGEFMVPGTAIRIVLAEVFAELDEMMTQG